MVYGFFGESKLGIFRTVGPTQKIISKLINNENNCCCNPIGYISKIIFDHLLLKSYCPFLMWQILNLNVSLH